MGLLYTQTRQLVISELAGTKKKMILHYLFCLLQNVVTSVLWGTGRLLFSRFSAYHSEMTTNSDKV